MGGRMRRRALFALPLALLAAGCGIAERVFGPIDATPTVYGSQPLSKSDEDVPIDLPRLIWPDIEKGAVSSRYSDGWWGATASAASNVTGIHGSYPQPDDDYEIRLERAYSMFGILPTDKQKDRRAEVQEALLGKSTTLCNLYKKRLLQTSTTQNLLTGDATTLLAGLGTIFAKAATVRPLAGSAAIVSGFRSEYNSDVFANLNLQVMTAGMEKRRSDWYATVLKARGCSMADYPLKQAVKDAFIYHESCSLYAGLEEANASIKQAQNPGLDQLAETLRKLAKLQKAVGAPPANATSPTPDEIKSFPATPTTQKVSATCELPIPGAPKATAQPTPAAQITVTTASGQVVTLPFADKQDPVAAVTEARSNINAKLNTLADQVKALPAAIASQSIRSDAILGGAMLTPQQVVDKARAHFLGMPATLGPPAVAAVAGTIDLGQIMIPGPAGTTIKPTAALNAYDADFFALEATSSDGDVSTNAAKVVKDQRDNANLSTLVQEQITAFNKAIQPVSDIVAKNQREASAQ
jgi:hypothetical protein